MLTTLPISSVSLEYHELPLASFTYLGILHRTLRDFSAKTPKNRVHILFAVCGFLFVSFFVCCSLLVVVVVGVVVVVVLVVIVVVVICSRRSMLCHMFRLGLKKAVVSHVCSVLEEACCVTCFAWG